MIWKGVNVRVEGMGSLHKVEWKKGYQTPTIGRLKVSFRVSDYNMIKGKVMIRESKINEVLHG